MTQTPLRLLQIGAWLICGCLSIPTLTLLAEDSAGQTKRPNILYLLVDDLGWADLGCYGSDLHETPNIDRLAAQSVRFTDAYAAAPVCTPTRAAIMSGEHPARLHMTIWREGAKNPPQKSKVIPPVTVEGTVSLLSLASTVAVDAMAFQLVPRANNSGTALAALVTNAL